MNTFIMLTRLAPGTLPSPRAMEDVERRVMESIRNECPGVEWIASYAVLGPADYVDIFKAPDLDSAIKVATLVRTYGDAQTEIWPGTEWQHFKELVRHLPSLPG